MKKLSELIDINSDIIIKGITDDSRKVSKDYLFVATKGFNVDHYDYIDSAIKNGCVFLVVDKEIDIDFPHIVVDKINDYYIELCKKYYDVDTNKLHFIGITGTDGKTTTSTIISKIIDNCAYLGTNGLCILDKYYSTDNTTPCISELYNDLSIVEKSNCKNIVMEVSSEALLHNRVNTIKYDIVGFTNITGDHLNIHKTFDNYVNCKKKLLNLVNENGHVVINGDDDVLHNFECNNMYTFGFNSDNMCVIKDVKYNDNNTIIDIVDNNKKYTITTLLKGKYNVYNVVMAFIICKLYGIDTDIIIDKIKTINNISGRCEFLDFGQEYDIVLDYAHTINGIRNILETFKDYNQIITITGCAGGREKSKRNTIGNIVMDNSDISIFTMDDPRYEDVDDIIDQMVGDRNDYIRIVDRECAINYALSIAGVGSIVLILGKGRDNYMAIDDNKVKYSDYDVVKKFFS